MNCFNMTTLQQFFSMHGNVEIWLTKKKKKKKREKNISFQFIQKRLVVPTIFEYFCINLTQANVSIIKFTFWVSCFLNGLVIK